MCVCVCTKRLYKKISFVHLVILDMHFIFICIHIPSFMPLMYLLEHMFPISISRYRSVKLYYIYYIWLTYHNVSTTINVHSIIILYLPTTTIILQWSYSFIVILYSYSSYVDRNFMYYFIVFCFHVPTIHTYLHTYRQT